MKHYCCQCGQLCDEKAVEENPDIWLCEQCQEDIENEYQNCTLRNGDNMKDQHEKVFESIADVLNKQTNMIVELAKRTLTAKDYMDYIRMFSEDRDKDERIKTLLEELDKKI